MAFCQKMQVLLTFAMTMAFILLGPSQTKYGQWVTSQLREIP